MDGPMARRAYAPPVTAPAASLARPCDQRGGRVLVFIRKRSCAFGDGVACRQHAGGQPTSVHASGHPRCCSCSCASRHGVGRCATPRRSCAWTVPRKCRRLDGRLHARGCCAIGAERHMAQHCFASGIGRPRGSERPGPRGCMGSCWTPRWPRRRWSTRARRPRRPAQLSTWGAAADQAASREPRTAAAPRRTAGRRRCRGRAALRVAPSPRRLGRWSTAVGAIAAAASTTASAARAAGAFAVDRSGGLAARAA